MKKGIYIAIIIALIGLACFQLGRITAPRASLQTNDNLSPYDEIELYDGEDFEAFVSDKFTGMTIDPALWEAVDHKGRTVSLDSLGGDSTIFARYSASGCRPCIDALLAALKLKAEVNSGYKFVLLIKNIPLRDLYVLNAEYGQQFKLLSCDNLPIDFNSAETPVAFRINNHTISEHFTCRYGYHERTNKYIERL